MSVALKTEAIPAIDEIDRRIVTATQAGLPLVPKPYHVLADALGLTVDDLMERLRRMQACGVIRRIGVIPNHYALGFQANGMSVWDVPDERARELGRTVGELSFVSHCYLRPRHLPLWRYNLFAMVHGRCREQVEREVAQIAELLGPDDRGHEILYSTQILKKTGLRLAS